MNKRYFFIWNAFISSLIGLAVFICGVLVAIEKFSFQRVFIESSHSPMVFLGGLGFCMMVGAIIGSVSLFCVYQIYLRFTQRPLIGYISNFIVVAALNIFGAIATGVSNYQFFKTTLWFYALPVSEVLSVYVTYLWYKRMKFYKAKLEQKKASLHQQRIIDK